MWVIKWFRDSVTQLTIPDKWQFDKDLFPMGLAVQRGVISWGEDPSSCDVLSPYIMPPSSTPLRSAHCHYHHHHIVILSWYLKKNIFSIFQVFVFSLLKLLNRLSLYFHFHFSAQSKLYSLRDEKNEKWDLRPGSFLAILEGLFNLIDQILFMFQNIFAGSADLCHRKLNIGLGAQIKTSPIWILKAGI